MLIASVVLLHDNAHPHTAARTRALLEHFDWELFDHPPHSPDLAPIDYHLLGSQRFNRNEECQNLTELTGHRHTKAFWW
jgi:hypothetical protein